MRAPFLLAVLLCVLSGCGSSSTPTPKRVEGAAEPPRKIFSLPESRDERPRGPLPGVAVVELYTSEGCSSCPPADDLLARIAARAEREALPIYALSFHVDYWNDQGWRDPFSQVGFSERQRMRAERRGSGAHPFTPELVVNGAGGLGGSDEATSGRAIERALERAPSLRVRVRAARRERAERDARGVPRADIEVRVDVVPPRDDVLVAVAVTQARASSRVTAGENAGSQLLHVNVVRSFTERHPTAGAVEWTAPWPESLPEADVGVIAYTQSTDGAVLGAGRAEW